MSLHGDCKNCKTERLLDRPLKAVAAVLGMRKHVPVYFCDRCDNGKDWPRFRT